MVRQIYLENFRKHQATLAQMLAALSVESETFVTRGDLIETLTRFLRRRMG